MNFHIYTLAVKTLLLAWVRQEVSKRPGHVCIDGIMISICLIVKFCPNTRQNNQPDLLCIITLPGNVLVIARVVAVNLSFSQMLFQSNLCFVGVNLLTVRLLKLGPPRQ